MCAYVPRIHAAGAELVIVGNGGTQQASDFAHRSSITTPLFTDPSLSTYRALNAKRGGGGLRLLQDALRALLKGHVQWRVMRDPRQHGAVFVIMRGGIVVYGHVGEITGDDPDPEQFVGLLAQAVIDP